MKQELKVSSLGTINNVDSYASQDVLLDTRRQKDIPEVIQANVHMALQNANIALMMLGRSTSNNTVASILQESIKIMAEQIRAINGWSEGGVEMFRACLAIMLDTMKLSHDNPTYQGAWGIYSTATSEDLLQLALLEIMCNGAEYGMEGWYNSNKTDISHLLEATGSGSHCLHEAAWDTPEKLAAVAGKLYDSIMLNRKNGNIPDGTLLADICNELERRGGRRKLEYSIVHNFEYKSGVWWVMPDGTLGNGYSPTKDLSPMLRLFILSAALNQNPELEKENVEIILTGQVPDIDKMLVSEFGISETHDKPYTPSLFFLTENTPWQIITTKDESKPSPQLDWYGSGIGLSDLDNLYKTFPGRALTDEEIEEMNRLVDIAQMLQESLKLWTEYQSNNRLATANNIS